ncbi:hypothetical protein HJC23_000182 [Cyclotella cryptica]|uniref:Uncharacterized protein n=1 Tax=Cyclotella cryptica TaxID=29204 RepID=A0ABD3QEA7_9STRA|eukprot:CCRYP_006374-RA/>CCRYP_006374-RA protein AED:0.01 eAED:0.01 QI:471/1/1/1/1/1/3/693/1177
MILSTSPLLLLLTLTPTTSQTQDRFTAHPSSPSTTTILAEQYLSTLSYTSPLTINSDVPVTLQKYSDTSTSFLMGQEPVPSNYGMVVVTSDCTTDETSVLPQITVSENGEVIDVLVGVSEEEGANNMSFLPDTTRYAAFWSYVFGFCGFNYFGTTTTAVNVVSLGGETASPVSSPRVTIPTASPTENATFVTNADPTNVSAAVDWNAYKECGFDCCANSDCGGGCCIEGQCQSNSNGTLELCADPPLPPPEGVACGAMAYKNFQADGNCPGSTSSTASAAFTTVAGATGTTAAATVTNATIDGVGSSISTTAAAINELTTTAAAVATSSGVPNPCVEGKCPNPDGQCVTMVMCFVDPCQMNNGGCPEGVECISNYCGGCNAICVGGNSSSIETTPAATTTASASTIAAVATTASASTTAAVTTIAATTGTTSTPSPTVSLTSVSTNDTSSLTAINETSAPTASVTANNDTNPCVQGQCLNLAGQCAQEVTCLTPPCDTIQCAPFQECVANLCGDCLAVCVGRETGSPTLDPSSKPTPFPSEVLVTPDPTMGPKPVPAVTETNTPGAASSGQSSNPPPTNVQPTPNNPTNPVVVVVNVPSPTVVVPAPSNNNSPPLSTTAATEPASDTTAFSLGSGTSPSPMSSDILDTFDNTSGTDVLDTPSPSSNLGDGTIRPSLAATPWPTGGDNTTGTNSPAPSVAAGIKRESIAAIEEGSSSSGFATRYSFNIRMAVTLLAVLVATLVLPGREGASFSVGKVFVAAVAVSSLFSRSDKNGNVRRSAKERSPVFPMRKLQATCTYNVEILYDGCTKNVQVNAPAARVIDVVLEDYTSETNAEDECQTDYTANLTFPVSTSTVDVDLSSNNTVAAYDYSDWQCQRAIEGRPFIDVTGKGIQALPMLVESCAGEMNAAWSREVATGSAEAAPRNVTHHNQVMLGNEWTQRALGEHASIASFSAFSIALMTNQAPSTLVEDALKAGLDEVRHARTSFEIASRLLGKNVEPSSLPESKHDFGQDLTALALAVAREGCVDETLSAFAAAAEVENINMFLEDEVGTSKYANVELDVLRWISSELKTIAMDESYHSALAWRTLKWVCSVNLEACSAVQREVFDASKLEMRFQQRSEGNASFASLLKREWERIHDAHKMSPSPVGCASTVEYSSNEPLISTLTEIVLHASLC